MSYGYPDQGPVVYGTYQTQPPRPPAPPKPGPGLGITGFILSFLACVGHLVLADLSAGWFLDLAHAESGSEEESAYKTVGAIVGQIALGVLNLVGIILNIIALATGRGRALGLLGLLIGVLVPVLAFFWFGLQTDLIRP